MARDGLEAQTFRACVELLGKLPSEVLPRMTTGQLFLLLETYRDSVAHRVDRALAGALVR